ncbi:hypothetical protein [Plesiocystis pacifica]|uniref:hypothetical protein n=1 Tax=Plesiocystis pacifica TaxID=191768 RepID=UPI0012F8E2E1|nr:hypothetical protein [Plesiocystis pacifica]
MLSLVLGTVVASLPPALPEDAPAPAAAVEGPAPVEAAPVDAAVEAPPASEPAPEAEAFVVEAAPAPAEAPPAADASIVVVPPPTPEPVSTPVVVITQPPPAPAPLQRVGYATPPPPWSGAGRIVGGSFLMIAGTGLLTAATFEWAGGGNTTTPLVSQIPAGVSMLVASGIMIGTGLRDQRALGEWETATKIRAKHSGNGLIIAGVSTVGVGSLAAVATSVATDLQLDAPRSIPAGWATAGVAIAGGTAMLIGGVVRRSRYGKWRDSVTGTPMVSPVRAGATFGVSGQF